MTEAERELLRLPLPDAEEHDGGIGAGPQESRPIELRARLGTIADSAYALHLQWFAAEDEGRTEAPTEYKIRKAREEGKVAKSAELTSALVLLFPVIVIGFLAQSILRTLLEMVTYFFRTSAELDVTETSIFYPVFFSYFMRISLPILLTAFVAAIAGNVLQVGFLFTTKPITPDLSRITPNFARFFSRSFFSLEALFNLAKSIFKVAVIGALAYLNFAAEIGRIANLVRVSFRQAFFYIAQISFRLLVEAAVAFLILSVFDYLFARYQHRQSLMMTRAEVKEERRMFEGDPLVRSRLRERMRDILTRNMMRNVPRADVVITNPTHFAVALEWKRETMVAPTVTAKGQDLMAKRIREIASEHDVPIVENKPLARTLYAEVEIGDTIPEKYYKVVAAVLAEVYRVAGSRGTARVR
jgi:flagellar biosynthetic protein FlhB